MRRQSCLILNCPPIVSCPPITYLELVAETVSLDYMKEHNLIMENTTKET